MKYSNHFEKGRARLLVWKGGAITFSLLLISGGWSTASVNGQETINKIPLAFSNKPTTCEINSLRLESVARLAAKEIHSGGVLIAIARNGTSERSNELARRRLHNIRVFFTQYQPLKDHEVITAQGSRSAGYGRVELYLGGKLVDVLLVERNKDICVECCDRDPKYYPDRRRLLAK